MACHGVGPETRRRIGALATSTDLSEAAIAELLGILPRTVGRVIARDGCRRPEPDLAALVERVRASPASPEARWDALVACLWGLSSHENRLQTGRDPGERAPILTPLEVRRLAQGAAQLEKAVAQARAALLRRATDGEGPHETASPAPAAPAAAPSLAEARAQLARRLAEAEGGGGDARAPAPPAGAAPGAAGG